MVAGGADHCLTAMAVRRSAEQQDLGEYAEDGADPEGAWHGPFVMMKMSRQATAVRATAGREMLVRTGIWACMAPSRQS